VCTHTLYLFKRRRKKEEKRVHVDYYNKRMRACLRLLEHDSDTIDRCFFLIVPRAEIRLGLGHVHVYVLDAYVYMFAEYRSLMRHFSTF
jgi:hypothetical protein